MERSNRCAGSRFVGQPRSRRTRRPRARRRSAGGMDLATCPATRARARGRPARRARSPRPGVGASVQRQTWPRPMLQRQLPGRSQARTPRFRHAPYGDRTCRHELARACGGAPAVQRSESRTDGHLPASGGPPPNVRSHRCPRATAIAIAVATSRRGRATRVRRGRKIVTPVSVGAGRAHPGPRYARGERARAGSISTDRAARERHAGRARRVRLTAPGPRRWTWRDVAIHRRVLAPWHRGMTLHRMIDLVIRITESFATEPANHSDSTIPCLAIRGERALPARRQPPPGVRGGRAASETQCEIMVCGRAKRAGAIPNHNLTTPTIARHHPACR